MTIARREFMEAVGGVAAVASVSSSVANDDWPPADRVRSIGANKVLLVSAIPP